MKGCKQSRERQKEGEMRKTHAKKCWFSRLRCFLPYFARHLFFKKEKRNPQKSSAKVQPRFFIVLLLPFAFPFALTPPLTPRLFFYSFLFHNCLFLRCVCLLNVFVTQCDDVFRDKELASQLTGSLCGLGRSPKSPVTRQKGQISWSCKPPTRK